MRLLTIEELMNILPPDDGYPYYRAFGETVAKAQAKLTREETLKEVREWIEKEIVPSRSIVWKGTLIGVPTLPWDQQHLLLESLKRGEMPK